ncbi:hypothetical protein OM416_20125 [Paenibacillus sp. LS1]|uniref:hypothetical protein n=1 Tax=Paenibacillus sp. LS1 TaxID=2992120 RepID=UPI00222F24E0|nr:hypothetical protein [Paenibacillus sp. LS1]MCW3793904.1 hypothetical protein [Paenibacillus sp. LS1]
MKVTDYKWERYISRRRLEKNKEKFNILYQIRDAIFDADLKATEKIMITIKKTKDYKEILGTAGSLHHWWVIDRVIEIDEKITLLYRNCKFHQPSDPNKLWQEEPFQLKKTIHVEPNSITPLSPSPSMRKELGWTLENFTFTIRGDKATVNCSIEIPSSSPELSEGEYEDQIELLITQVIRGMGYAADKPIFTWGTKTHIKDEFFFLYSGVIEHYK